MAGMGGNYYAALGMEVARNDGSDYSKAASSSLSNASDSLHSIFNDTNKAFENGKTGIKDLFGILGTQATKDSPGSGWLGLTGQLAQEEKNTNREIAEQNANTAFDNYIKQKREDLNSLLVKTNKNITDAESINSTGLTTDNLTSLIDSNIEKLYIDNINKDKNNVGNITSQVPFTPDYVKRLILEPASYQLVKPSLSEAQKATVEKLMADSNFVNAVKQEHAIKQAESDRANGIWSDSQLMDLAKELKANNHTINNDMTTQDIYDMLVLERNAKMGRKANETMEEFNLRKAEAQNKLNNYLFGFSQDANKQNSNNNSNSTPNSSSSSSSSSSTKSNTKRTLVNTKGEGIDENDIGKGLLHLDIEDDISPTTLLAKMGDEKAKGEIVLNEETGLPKGIQDEMPKYFKAEQNIDSETYSADTTLLPTIGINDAQKYNERLHKNLAKLTPEGQQIYRNMIGLENKITKAKINLNRSEDAKNIKELRVLKDVLARVQNNSLTYDDIQDIKDINIDNFKYQQNKETASYLKEYIGYQEKLNSKLSNTKDSKFQKMDRTVDVITNKIANTQAQIKAREEQIRNSSDPKAINIAIGEKEKLEEEEKKLRDEKQTALFRNSMAILDNTPLDKVAKADEKSFASSNAGATYGVILDQNEIKVGNKIVDVSQAKKQLYGDNITNPQMGLLYHAFSEALDMNKTSSIEFLKEVLSIKEIQEIFNEYNVYANKLKASNNGKTLTEEELKSNSFISTTLADTKRDINKKINEILSQPKYAHLKPKFGDKYKTTNKNPEAVIQYAGRLLVNYHLMQPENVDDVQKLIRITK